MGLTLKSRKTATPSLLWAGVGLCLAWHASPISSASDLPVYGEAVSQLVGIYQAVPQGTRIPGLHLTVKNDPVSLDLTSTVRERVTAQHATDPKDLCQVLGPFRMMALPETRFEILRDAPDKLVMLFQKSSWGHVRTIGLNTKHPLDYSKVRPMWNGDSIATWDKDTLVIDTIHFTAKTWLSDAGVANSRQLHLTERLRLLDDGRYLRYQATATDPEVLVHPATYTRYFVRSNQEITEDNCFRLLPKSPQQISHPAPQSKHPGETR